MGAREAGSVSDLAFEWHNGGSQAHRVHQFGIWQCLELGTSSGYQWPAASLRADVCVGTVQTSLISHPPADPCCHSILADFPETQKES